MHKLIIFFTFIFIFVSCATAPKVRQEDLDAWTGVSIEALDTHSLFNTVPMKEVKTKDGFTYRYYNNSESFLKCITNSSSSLNPANQINSSANLNKNSNTTCYEKKVGCNNVFLIKDETVVSYEPKGQCYTDERVQPEGRYRKVKTKKND